MLRPLLSTALLAVLTACSAPDTDSDLAGTRAHGGDAPTDATRADGTPANAPPAGADHGPYPIVLLHGMGGFAKLDLPGPVDVEMFTGVVEDLEKSGNKAFMTTSPPFASSVDRAPPIAEQIKKILKDTGAKKVNLIGHSQGGLDARLIVSPAGLNMSAQVASVVTVSTPHQGSRVADVVLGHAKEDGLLERGTDTALGVATKRFFEAKDDPEIRAQLVFLSEKHMKEEFNPKFKDAPGVLYLSYAGRANKATGEGVCDGGEVPNDPTKTSRTNPNLLATAKILDEGQGKVNDGLVTVESAKWGKFQTCIAADHNAEVIGRGGFDQVAFFHGVVDRIRKEGL